MNGLSSINIELTSRCNKSCAMCGRRKIEDQSQWGDMPFDMFLDIARQLPSGIMVQLHNNGEPLLYPRLKQAILILKERGCLVSFDSNGKLAYERASDLVYSDLDSIAFSIIPDDPEGHDQMRTIEKFLIYKRDKKAVRPLVVFRVLGMGHSLLKKDTERIALIKALKDEFGAIMVFRQLHNPMGSRDYEKPTTKPETGICLEMLHKLSIDRHGNVSPCVRFDPEGKGIMGNVGEETLQESWQGLLRHDWISDHINGKRDRVPICKTCDYWGIPRG